MDVRHFEREILKLAFETDARITAPSAAYYLGIPTRDANRMLNELLRDGVLELDSDPDGNLYYRVPMHSEGMPARSPQPAEPEPVEPKRSALAGHTLVDPGASADDAPAFSPTSHRPQAPPTDGAAPPTPPERDPGARGPVVREAPQGGYASIFEAVERVGAERKPSRAQSASYPGAVTISETDAWIGNCGASGVLVDPSARCEPRPLGGRRPTLVSCADPKEESSIERTHLAHAEQQFWRAPEHQARPVAPNPGALMLAPARGGVPATYDLEQPEHQPGMALLLSLILPGTGQIYNGEVTKGIAMMVSCFLLWAFFLLGFVVHIWSIIDAVVVAERFNQRQRI